MLGEALGLSVWCQDEAGPYQTVPQPGSSWQPEGEPYRQPSEYIRNGTAKLLTLFHPATGIAHVKGVVACPNAVLHPWLKEQLDQILADLPPTSPVSDTDVMRQMWSRWQEGLSLPFTLPENLPPLRMLLVWDNLAGHKTPEMVLWLVQHGIMPLYTPLSGSWLNMAESVQRILVGRALAGQHPLSSDQLIAWLEAVTHHWNAQPTPFVWGGKRRIRRQRSHQRRYALGGSGACTHRRLARRPSILNEYLHAKQTTH
jgi:hypothetical protein